MFQTSESRRESQCLGLLKKSIRAFIEAECMAGFSRFPFVIEILSRCERGRIDSHQIMKYQRRKILHTTVLTWKKSRGGSGRSISKTTSLIRLWSNNKMPFVACLLRLYFTSSRFTAKVHSQSKSPQTKSMWPKRRRPIM